ncbi:MAG: substrate-binding domain-containing protein [Lachnospiraceae bacterium]|nr:substrate-binding domain-containing protein [Lachnospiraceae bacterium]
MKKKIVTLFMVAALAATALVGCGGNEATEAPAEETVETVEDEAVVEETEEAAESDFDYDNDIAVISREDGSGTRGAFIELFGVEQKNEAGEKIDYTTVEATITNNTSVMMTTVANDEYAIGYISLGYLNDTVKALKIDGVEASVENIENGTYTVNRPFNLAVKEELTDAAADFMNYILSAEGQAIVNDNGYIMIDNAAAAYESNGAEGKVVVAGSSSVTPVMEKLKEAYAAVNANVTVEINTSDSSTGVSSAIEGTCDIGMASRALKDTETAEGVKEVTIAKDGIAVIVNNNNPVEDLTTETVKNIYVGDILTWSEI